MIQIEKSDVTELTLKLDQLRGVLPEVRAQIMPELAQDLLGTVQLSIRGSLNDSHGKVQSWQASRLGSGMGYAAVSPKSDAYQRGYAVGRITQALETGHATRKRNSASKSRYRARVRVQRVPGRYFYKGAADELPRLAEKFSRALRERMEDELK